MGGFIAFLLFAGAAALFWVMGALVAAGSTQVRRIGAAPAASRPAA